ncbi:methyl-accepting chemotaxis protein [Halobaculum marinum]|uniref:Methyl-accepting chemotaxis protein n=1 Tax=Halobaculum marinum TaxID=3031996 RepID=A0ABD5WTG4_9EURY|nr:methyl-accepting chemotaxis protein [Halobaculum sp. DT55]
MRQILPGRLRGSYAAKFTIVVVAIVVFTGSVGAYSYTQTKAEIEHQVDTELTTSTATQSDKVALWVSQRRQTAQMVSRYDVMSTGNDVLIDAFLDAETDALPADVYDVYYVNETTNEVLASTGDDSDEHVFTAEEAAWATEDRSFDESDDVYRSDQYDAGGTPTIAFVSQVANDDDRIVVVKADVTNMSASIESTFTGGFSMVVDTGDGEVMMDETGDNLDTTYELGTDTAVVRDGAAGNTDVVSMDPVDGLVDERFLLGYSPVAGTDWVVVTHVPASEAYAISDSVEQYILLLVGGALVGLVALGVTIGRSTVRSLTDLKRKANALEDGDLDVAVESDRSDEIGQLYEAFAGMRDSLKTQIAEASAAAEEAARQREQAQAMSARMRDRADDYSAVMAECADGDLTARMAVDTDDRAMREIGEAFNEMMDDLERALGRVDAVADEVARVSETASHGVEEAERAATEVAASVEEISAGADEQADHLTDVTDEMATLSATVEEVAATAEQVADRSETAAERGERGSTLADDAITEMGTIESHSEETAAVVRGLKREVEEIGAVVDLIDGIAEQTNTLALNASIEAARAGAEGDGFAVVADEVKQLATETRDATKRIDSLIDGVQSSTDDAVADIEEMRTRVDDGSETVAAGLNALRDVVDAVEEANDGMQSISTAADDQATSTEEVVSMAEEVAAVGEQTAAEASTVSAAAEEQSASLDQVSAEVGQLAERAEGLRRLTDRFETRTVDAAAAPQPTLESDDLAAATDGGDDAR